MLLLGFFFFPLFFIFFAPFLFLMLMGAVFGRRRGWRHYGPHSGWRDSALDTLEARYARGEIDRDEYFARRDDLTSELS